MKKTLFVALWVAPLLFLAGCAEPPKAEADAANAALQAAKTAEADVYAGQAFTAARDTLNAALAAVKEQDGKFALFRNYDAAKAQLVKASEMANQSGQAAAAEKERIKTELTGMQEQLVAALAAADTALMKAPVGKGNKADIELIKSDLSAARTAFDAAVAEFNQGKYLPARTKFQTVSQRVTNIMNEITTASEKAKGKKK
ncbi:MAG: hypothetical protein H6506_02305 [Calditrichaeota bacterium]|nr:hypothetical protein [Calditrichota bacterium]MCB9367050.1 hypothetical protein [Calditrichota bacterium]MCB9391466.1 hypothetical protein [Calditrichota bacterium]